MPTLLAWVAYGDADDPRTQEALTVLIRIRPLMLAPLVLMIESDNRTNNLVDVTLDKIAYLFWTRLDEEGDPFDVFVHELERYPNDALGFLVYVLCESHKNWWDIAAQAIAVIGYPRNASAITKLLRLASDFFWLPQPLTNVIDCEHSELRTGTDTVGRRIIVNLVLTLECEAVAPLLFYIRGKGRFLIHVSLREMVEEAGIKDVLFAPLDTAESSYARGYEKGSLQQTQ